MSEKKELIKRMAMFLIGCVGIRLSFVYMAKNMKPEYLQYMSIFAIILAVSWILIYKFNLREYGREAGGKIWWNYLRPIHAIMYFAFAILAITKNKNAWVPLLVDVMLGLSAFGVHHYTNGDFSKILKKSD